MNQIDNKKEGGKTLMLPIFKTLLVKKREYDDCNEKYKEIYEEYFKSISKFITVMDAMLDKKINIQNR
jgi:hypothetical protein